MIAAGDELADPEIPSVYFDFSKAITEAVGYLYRKRGCRRIAFLGEWIDSPTYGTLGPEGFALHSYPDKI